MASLGRRGAKKRDGSSRSAAAGMVRDVAADPVEGESTHVNRKPVGACGLVTAPGVLD